MMFMMKTLSILSVVFCAALSIRATTGVPASVQQEDKPTPNLDVDSDTAVQPRARVQFCLDGWLSFRGNCYFLSNNADTWSNAESFCGEFEASLASVHNIWEYNFIQQTVKTGGHTLAWIGGYYFQGNWRWEDGSLFNYHRWQTESPAHNYQCIQLNSQESRGWSNQICDVHLPFVCQKTPDC
ncbi:snaclec coagulation factor IX/factor X-binding protein subunit B3-like [Channa argus]|uniref:snaclec coagulation factor IX/factor X-binding protein subunit B3-like n=1 Tax=Channa argus TaxID=215402 RepID=UPI0035214CCC